MSPTSIVTPSILRSAIALALLAACGGTDNADPDALMMCQANANAPTYSQLYTKYFGPGTQGHCGNSGCHSSVSDGNTWACGATKESCYQGMLGVGLIDTMNPLDSRIGDPVTSPLRWVNSNGVMPADAAVDFPEGRDAIKAWLAACAPQ